MMGGQLLSGFELDVIGPRAVRDGRDEEHRMLLSSRNAFGAASTRITISLWPSEGAC